jgi:methionyl-tRNA synthetase
MLANLNGKSKTLVIALIVVFLIDLILKGFALWRASRNKHHVWFIILLVFESAGLLPLIYLLWFTKDWEKEDSV